MILDAQLLFSDEQAITAAAASTNVYDMGVARDLGVGKELYVVIVVDVAFTDAGSDSTLTVEIETDDAAGFGSALVVQNVGTFGALAAIGATLIGRLAPLPANPWEQFIRLQYTPNNGNLTTGSVTAAIVTNIDAYTFYPDNSQITT